MTDYPIDRYDYDHDSRRFPPSRYAIGTRAVVIYDGRWLVVCATCDAGGSRPYAKRSDALSAAVRLSNRPCRACGAR